KYIINTGASRSSKTVSLIDLYDVYARQNPNKRMTVWRDTKIDCKKTVLVDALKRHKNTKRYQNGYKFNKTESIFDYSNGSTVEIHGTDDEETVHGLTQDAAWLNEPYKISIDTFDQIDQRTSDFLIIDWNPKKDHWIDNLAKRDNAIVIHSTYKDNPFCPPEQRKKIESYQPVSHSKAVEQNKIREQDAHSYDFDENPSKLPEHELRELLRCVQNEQSQSANQYKWEVYGLGKKAERPNRIFHFKEIQYRDYLALDVPVFYGVDWGVVDPMGIIEVKYYDGALYIHELSYASENDLKSKLDITEIAQINSQVEEGFLQWYFKRLGIDPMRPIICDNNRPIKIVALRTAGYNWAVAAEKKPGSIIDGIDLLNNLDVYYTSDSKNLAYEQEMYSRRTDPRTGEVLEEPEDAYNHCFVGDTLITLENDIKQIKDIKVGDRVLTSKGYRNVLHKFNNGVKKVSEYRIVSKDKVVYLTCTD
ncbi:MAG: phage terminase large subunit, partial [Kangiellaceae bacterium]|nr:phage terminase large subunit [Kangiellaceae bacterium]